VEARHNKLNADRRRAKRKMRRVAILLRNGQEIQQVCQDQDAALKWMKENWRAGDGWVCIENEDLIMLRLARRKQMKPFVTAKDIVFLREIKVGL
jgi:hypothetical protein